MILLVPAPLGTEAHLLILRGLCEPTKAYEGLYEGYVHTAYSWQLPVIDDNPVRLVHVMMTSDASRSMWYERSVGLVVRIVSIRSLQRRICN